MSQYREHLDRILASSVFKNARQSSKLLEFLVSRMLENDTENLKEYTIAVEAFGLSSTFDPQINPRIRVEVKRLRDRLEKYYSNAGHTDQIEIRIPKGAYKIDFIEQEKNPGYSEQPKPVNDENDKLVKRFGMLAIDLTTSDYIRETELEGLSHIIVGLIQSRFFTLGHDTKIGSTVNAPVRISLESSIYSFKGSVSIVVKLIHETELISLEFRKVSADDLSIDNLEYVCNDIGELISGKIRKYIIEGGLNGYKE